MALIQVRRDTAAAWTAANTTLASGEIGYETNTGKFKIGDGSAWSDLVYAAPKAYSDLTGTPNLTVYLTTANATATYLPAANFTYANLTGPQNLQDTELIRAKIRDYSETVSSPTISSGTLTLNLETSNIFTVSLNAAITTLTISNPPASGSGGSFTLILTADGTARAVTWPASIKWAGGTAPTLTSTSGKIDTFAFFSSDGGTTWQGYVGGQNF